LVRFWYVFGTVAVRPWHSTCTTLVRDWYVFGTFLVRFWYILGTFLVQPRSSLGTPPRKSPFHTIPNQSQFQCFSRPCNCMGATERFEEGLEITVTGATRLKSKHTILPPYTKIVTSSNLASGPFSYHPQHRSQRRRHEKGSRSASG